MFVQRNIDNNDVSSKGIMQGYDIRVTDTIEGIVAESRTLREVLAQAEMVAPTDCPVLLYGETGTGKEVIAELIHKHSLRREHALIKVNCAAIPSGLLESELFGHEKGAFTGAVLPRPGRFELADKGTLFLDEVGDIPTELQPKLLRVLQEQQFERLGSTRTIRTHARLIAATHRDLQQMADQGTFRTDLFYRLHVFPITIPPLRERVEDIPPLVRYFTRKYAEEFRKNIDVISEPTMETLIRYSWPGNIRELQNFVERAVVMSQGPELKPPLTELIRLSQNIPAEPVKLRDVERAHILRTLEKTNGQLAGAATLLGVPRSTLFYRIRRLGITLPRVRNSQKMSVSAG